VASRWNRKGDSPLTSPSPSTWMPTSKFMRLARSRFAGPFAAAVLVAAAAFGFTGTSEAEPGSIVYINGRPSRVYFNDGDSFRVLSGSAEGTKARLGGFNTLENFGPAHSWGKWHPYELYVISKQATLNARRGVWHCTTEGDTDTYGRTLMFCPDLIVDALGKGLAMAYGIDETPAPPEYLRAQESAKKKRLGMWAHGIPEFIMTSVHSADEGRDHNYNRLISTRDGHTEKWEHQDTYEECQQICSTEVRPVAEELTATAKRMRENPELAPLLKDWFNINLEEFTARYVRSNELPGYLSADLKVKLRAFLAGEIASGRLSKGERAKGSCMMFIEFNRWYGPDRAPCLRGKKH
jgi:endonuclease YncB( thermonuclease family)